MDTETRCLFRALFRKQLREQGAFLVRSASTGRHRTRAGRLAFGALYGGIVLLVMGSFFSLAWPLGELLLPAGQEALYFLTMELLALAVGVFAGAFSSYGSLFQARDNDLLLAMPIPPWMIFAVRMSGLYAMCLFYLLLLWVPAEVVYGLYAASPLGGLLSAVPMALVLAGAATLLAALLGWVVTLPPALLCLGCGLVLLRAPWTSALLAGLLVALDVVFTAAAGLMFGVTMPRFHWTSEMAVIKQNPSVLLALLVNWAAGFVLGVGVLVLAQFVSAEAAWMAALGILALADGAALRWLKTKGAERLRRL